MITSSEQCRYKTSSSGAAFSAQNLSNASACARVLGNPSNKYPCLINSGVNQCSIKPSTIDSGTNSPRSIYCRARSPSSVPCAISRRNHCPVEICSRLNFVSSFSAIVPLPEPGGPSRTTLRFMRSPRLETTFHAALLQEAVIMAVQQMGFHLPHRVKQHTHRNEQAGATKKLRDRRIDIQGIAQQHRNQCDQNQENRSRQGNAAHRPVKILTGRLTRTNAGNVPAVFF